MDQSEYAKPQFPPDAFASTASYYARYRVPYPRCLLQDLVQRAGVTGEGRLLDLACGPGRVAFGLADAFEEILAVDSEPEMIAEGKQEAARRGVHHIEWSVGKAESLLAPSYWFELITIGEALHRLDQQKVTEQARIWLQRGHCLSVIGTCSRAEDWEPWQRVVAEIVHKWTGRVVSTGGVSTAHVPGGGTEHTEWVLQQSGFVEVSSYTFRVPHDWNLESILGNLYSLSVCSKRVLGNNADAFATDLKAALLAHDPGGRYHETMHFGYTLGRKPA